MSSGGRRRPSSNMTADEHQPGGPPLTFLGRPLPSSFGLLAVTAALLFYARLFELDPSLRPLFADPPTRLSADRESAAWVLTAGFPGPPAIAAMR